MGRPPKCPQAKREACKFFDVVESVFREPKALFEIVNGHRERGRTDDAPRTKMRRDFDFENQIQRCADALFGVDFGANQ